MIVVDASSWIRSLIDASAIGDAVRAVLRDHPRWFVPAHAPLEVLRTLRRYEVAGELSSAEASLFAQEVLNAEVKSFGPEHWILQGSWQDRHNLSVYDAPYVVIARAFGLPLVTLDRRLSVAAHRLGAEVITPG